jgi:hypothetical protein
MPAAEMPFMVPVLPLKPSVAGSYSAVPWGFFSPPRGRRDVPG